MTDKEIETLKAELKKNPVFNMSLSGKEIFHSNVLAWLLSETDEKDEPTKTAKKLSKFFCPINKNNNEENKKEEKQEYRVLTVFREKNNFDLLIVYLPKEDYEPFLEVRKNATTKINIEDATDEIIITKDEGKETAVINQMELLKKCKFVVVENKFKAIPDATQLERYYLNICGYKQKQDGGWKSKLENITFAKVKNARTDEEKRLKILVDENNTTCYLLAPKKANDLFVSGAKIYKSTNTETGTKIEVQWNLVSYDDMLEEIKPDNQNKVILDGYKDFTEKMLKLSEDAVAIDVKTELYEFEKNVKSLKPIRIHDFYEKLRFSAIMNLIKEQFKNDSELESRVGYSNGMGILDFVYSFSKKSGNLGIPIPGKYGIQIQGKQLRIVVYPDKNYNWVEDKGKKKDKETQYVEIYTWLKEIYEQIKTDSDESFDYPVVEKLSKFDDFKYIKITIKEHITIEVLGKKIKEVLGIMKDKEKDFNGDVKEKK
jgi:hypothetical protein